MFDIGWTELLVVAVVAILVVGPKDLPRMLRTFGQTMGKMRRMASDFQGQFNDAVREAERQVDLDGVRKSVSDVTDFDPLADIKKDLGDTQAALKEEVTPSIEAPSPSPTGASEPAPEDNGGTDIGGDDGNWTDFVDTPSTEADVEESVSQTPAQEAKG
jgi:sec-independent protein translocase protein TatB